MGHWMTSGELIWWLADTAVWIYAGYTLGGKAADWTIKRRQRR